MYNYYVLTTAATGGKISSEVIECLRSNNYRDENLDRVKSLVKRKLAEYPRRMFVSCVLCRDREYAETYCEILNSFDVYAAEFTPRLDVFLTETQKELERISHIGIYE